MGFQTIMVNYNPETVSTDYDICDRLYFDELSFERVLDIYEKENPLGVVLAMGGQIPNNIAMKCHEAGMRVLGTSPLDIDRAENRFKFSKLLDELDVDQPAWKELRSVAEAKTFARSIGYPVLIRPSYVLSGAAMSIVFHDRDLDHYLRKASHRFARISRRHLQVHHERQGDRDGRRGRPGRGHRLGHRRAHRKPPASTRATRPWFCRPRGSTSRPSAASARSAPESPKALSITGPFNIQFIAKDNTIKVIECNLRASRSFPFVSKVARDEFYRPGRPGHDGRARQEHEEHARSQLRRRQGAPVLLLPPQGGGPRPGRRDGLDGGSRPRSDATYHEAFLKAIIAAGFVLPERNILLSLGGDKAKQKFLPSAERLRSLGFTLFATEHTSQFLKRNGVPNTRLHKVHEKQEPNIRDPSSPSGKIDLVISVPNPGKKKEFNSDYRMRRMAVDYSIPLLTNLQIAELFRPGHLDEEARRPRNQALGGIHLIRDSFCSPALFLPRIATCISPGIELETGGNHGSCI